MRGGGGKTIGKGVLACDKGNHGAGAWVARVRVSAHTVWTWSSFLLLCKLQMNHMLRSLLKRHSPSSCCSLPMRRRSSRTWRRSSPSRRCNFLKNCRFPVVRRLLMSCTKEGQSMSLEAEGPWERPVLWWMVAVMEEEVEDWCRHTGGTGTVVGTVDTVGIDAFAGSTLCRT